MRATRESVMRVGHQAPVEADHHGVVGEAWVGDGVGSGHSPIPSFRSRGECRCS
jgi:hypothetical protein